MDKVEVSLNRSVCDHSKNTLQTILYAYDIYSEKRLKH